MWRPDLLNILPALPVSPLVDNSTNTIPAWLNWFNVLFKTVNNLVGSIQILVVTAQKNVTNSTTLVTPTNLSASVVKGATYSVKVRIAGTAGAGGGFKCALVGTNSMTATSANYTAWNWNSATINAVSNTTTFGNTVGAINAIITDIILEGVVVVNAAGTLNFQFAQNTANGVATSVFINSYMEVKRVF